MAHDVTFNRPEGVRVALRRMKFDFESGFDRYWHSGSPFLSLFWTQLSTAFGPGEQFFIDSARALKECVNDEKLMDELQEFCRQEGHHTFQHLRFDRVNELQGVDVKSCRKRYEWALKLARKTLTPKGMLSVTVALEHLTSGFASVYFNDPSLSAGADPKVDALWGWHAAEEAEHKATCFDVYVAAGGEYWRRVALLPGAWAVILILSMINTAALLQKDGKLWTQDTVRGLGYLFGPRRGLITQLMPTFFDYFRPGFHPWEHDNSDEIAAWQAANSEYIQSGPGAKAA